MSKKKGFWGEFKEFISRGSVIDLAVGVIIGGAFTTIVNSLVKDIVMPIVGWLIGGINFTALKFIIRPAAEGVEESAIYYGNFIQNIVNFLIIALVIFITVRVINKFRKKEEAKKPVEAPKISDEVKLLTEIRDLMVKQDKEKESQL